MERSLALATDESELRTAWAKRRALADDGARWSLGRALFGDGPARATDPALVVFLMDEVARLHPEEALGPYLVGRQLAGRVPRLALGPLAQACPLDGTVRPFLLSQPFSRSAVDSTASQPFSPANAACSSIYQALRDQATLQSDRLRATDFLERIAWQASQ